MKLYKSIQLNGDKQPITITLTRPEVDGKYEVVLAGGMYGRIVFRHVTYDAARANFVRQTTETASLLAEISWEA